MSIKLYLTKYWPEVIFSLIFYSKVDIMVSTTDLYHKQFRQYGYGYALFKPVSTNELQIGSCGYFTSDGTWNKIALLTDPKATERLGLTPLDTNLLQSPEPDLGLEWGPLHSESVSKKEINFDVSAA